MLGKFTLRFTLLSFSLFQVLCSYNSYCSTIYARANGDWDDTSIWSTIGPGGASCSRIPISGEDVVIDGFSVDFDLNSVDITINSLLITNAFGGVATFNISDGRVLSVTNDVNVIMADNINKAVTLMLTTNSNPKLLIGGDLIYTREVTNVRNRTLILDISGDGEVIVDGDYNYDYLNSANHATNAIYMDAFASLEIKGDFTATIAATANNGDFNITVQGNATLQVGSLASPKTFLIDQIGGVETNLSIAGGAADPNFNIFATALFRTSSAGDMTIDVSNDGAFYVEDSLIFEQTGGGLIDINIPGSGAYIDTKELIFDATGTGKIDISLSNMDAFFNLRGNVLQTNGYGLFNATNGTFIYNGDIFQTFVPNGTGADAWTYHDVRIDNSYSTFPQIVMGGTATFMGDITFVDGIVRTTITDLLIQDANNGSAFGAVDSSYVDGPYKKIGGNAFTFPVGKNQFYRPIGIGQPGLGSDAYIAEYFYDNPIPVFGWRLCPDILPFHSISGKEYWTLDRTAGTTDVEVTLSWNDSSDVSDHTELVVARFDVADDEWKNEGSRALTGNNSAGTITTLDTIRTWTPFMGFTLGTASAVNALPIDFVNFNAEPVDLAVQLTWETSAEVNNDYFTIERSPDGINWEEIQIIKGAGTSNMSKEYFSTDEQPLYGMSYYRLKQTDFNGNYKYVDARMVEFPRTKENDFLVFPNPGNGEEFNLIYQNQKISYGVVTIHDMSGKIVYSKEIRDKNMNELETLKMDQILSSGNYVLNCSLDDYLFTEKICVRK